MGQVKRENSTHQHKVDTGQSLRSRVLRKDRSHIEAFNYFGPPTV